MTSAQKLTVQVERATHRLAQLKAQALLRQMQHATQLKARNRRLEAQRRSAIGHAVVAAGFGDIDPEAIVALLAKTQEPKRRPAYLADLSPAPR